MPRLKNVAVEVQLSVIFIFKMQDIRNLVNGIQILKLAESSTVKMHLSNEGALQLTVDSGIGEYQFILPAQSK